ncbi:hypothetical protein [Microcoleus sp. B13-B6]|uniref:hypothetical protein n=1 Tax=Microcoleus sp. B13-B6 TaxID=2818652 RepID=UPI002FCEBB0E
MLVRSSVTEEHLFKGRNSIAQAVAIRSPEFLLTWMPGFDTLGRLRSQLMIQCYQLLVCFTLNWYKTGINFFLPI